MPAGPVGRRSLSVVVVRFSPLQQSTARRYPTGARLLTDYRRPPMQWQAIALAIFTGMLGLLAGLILERRNHSHALERLKAEVLAADARQKIERCIEVFNARVEYVIAFNRRTSDVAQRRRAYYDLMHAHWYARPEVLVPPDVWAEWMAAERHARDRDAPIKDRMTQVGEARRRALDWLAARRGDLVAGTSTPSTPKP